MYSDQGMMYLRDIILLNVLYYIFIGNKVDHKSDISYSLTVSTVTVCNYFLHQVLYETSAAFFVYVLNYIDNFIISKWLKTRKDALISKQVLPGYFCSFFLHLHIQYHFNFITFYDRILIPFLSEKQKTKDLINATIENCFSLLLK